MYTIRVIEDVSSRLPDKHHYDPVWGLAPNWKDVSYIFRFESSARFAALSAIASREDEFGPFRTVLRRSDHNAWIVEFWYDSYGSSGSLLSSRLSHTARFGWK